MISSLRSIFDGLARRVFYADGQDLSVYECQRGVIRESFVFKGDDTGRRALADYLRKTMNVTSYLLVDVVEEEYRRDTLPHVFGQDRRNLIRHRTERAFRDTPYRYAQLQGRVTEGRRDDKVLFSALTNPLLLQAWLDLMLQHKVPLAGIYSLPLLSTSLLPHLHVVSEHSLVVSLQGAGRLRQSLFQDGYLKLSRLAQISTDPGEEAKDTLEEVEKLHRYLASLRLLPRSGTLDVYLIGHGPMLAALEGESTNTGSIRYHPVDTTDLAQDLGMGEDFSSPYAEGLFVQLMLRGRPAEHYGTPDQTQYFNMRRLRFAMVAAGVVLLAGSTLWAGLQLAEGVLYRERALVGQQQAKYYAQRYEEAKAAMPATPAEPVELKAAVDIARLMEENRATPLRVMTVLGKVLKDYPGLYVNEFQWHVTDDAELQPKDSGFGTAGLPGNTGLPGGGGASGAVYESSLVYGYVSSFDGDFRKALELVERFAADLSSREGVHAVKIISSPLNVSSSESLRGVVGARPGSDRAPFAIRVVLRHGMA